MLFLVVGYCWCLMKAVLTMFPICLSPATAPA